MTRSEYFRQCNREYMLEHGVTEVDPDKVSEWMVQTGRFSEAPISPARRCRKELVRALKEEVAVDPQGRSYRVNQAVPITIKGETKTFWGNIFDLKPKHMRMSLAVRMRQIEGAVARHHTDTSSYNDNNKHGGQIPLFDYDLNRFIAEKDQPTDYPDSPPDRGDDGSAAASS